MSATAARIAFITTPFRRAVSTTPAAQTRHGANARQTDDPVPTFFDNVADAQAIADARQTLLSAERRRFRVQTRNLESVIGVSYAGTLPLAAHVDTERSVNTTALVCDLTFDLGRMQAAMTLWG